MRLFVGPRKSLRHAASTDGYIMFGRCRNTTAKRALALMVSKTPFFRVAVVQARLLHAVLKEGCN